MFTGKRLMRSQKTSLVSAAFDFGGKYGMTKARFLVMTECFRLKKYTIGAMGESGYQPIESFLNAFKESRNIVINPGIYIFTDECMRFWKGMESRFNHESFIHVSYIPRKPVVLS